MKTATPPPTPPALPFDMSGLPDPKSPAMVRVEVIAWELCFSGSWTFALVDQALQEVASEWMLAPELVRDWFRDAMQRLKRRVEEEFARLAREREEHKRLIDSSFRRGCPECAGQLYPADDSRRESVRARCLRCGGVFVLWSSDDPVSPQCPIPADPFISTQFRLFASSGQPNVSRPRITELLKGAWVDEAEDVFPHVTPPTVPGVKRQTCPTCGARPVEQRGGSQQLARCEEHGWWKQ